MLLLFGVLCAAALLLSILAARNLIVSCALLPDRAKTPPQGQQRRPTQSERRAGTEAKAKGGTSFARHVCVTDAQSRL